MQTVKISSKNQIVVPTVIRKNLGLTQGSKLVIYQIDQTRAIISKLPKKGSYVDSMVGLGKEVWDKLGGVDKYIQGERESWGDR